MPGVKPRRPYASSLRRQQAVQTRARILDAAQELFGKRGYPATTMEAVASEAGVATDTVYAAFRNKAGVLHALMDVRVGGDDRPIALIDREGPQAVRAETDQRRQVAGFASDITGILARARPVDDILRSAAAVDPEIAELRARLHESRYQNMRTFVSWLARNGPLRGGIGQDEAAAIVWTLASPEVHRLLTGQRDWSPARYTEWLSGTLARELLS